MLGSRGCGHRDLNETTGIFCPDGISWGPRDHSAPRQTAPKAYLQIWIPRSQLPYPEPPERGRPGSFEEGCCPSGPRLHCVNLPLSHLLEWLCVREEGSILAFQGLVDTCSKLMLMSTDSKVPIKVRAHGSPMRKRFVTGLDHSGSLVHLRGMLHF